MSDDPSRASTLDRVAACLGDDAFNRLVDAVEDTLKKGRLRLWQERLFERLAADAGISIRSLDAYAALFGGSPRRAIVLPPLTREAFLADPNRCFYRGRAPEIAAAWFAEAWAILPAFRDNLTYELTRSVGKHGELSDAEQTAAYLNGALTPAEVVTLYETIRDESSRPEDEWRGDFERLVAAHAAILPDVRPPEEPEPADD